MTQTTTHDVIVLGSGVGGLATAVAARKLGLSVLLLEVSDRVGGGTCYSSGLIWAGCNHLAAAAGLEDDPDSVRSYMNFLGGNQHDPALMGALVDESALALQFFESCGIRFQLLSVADHYYRMHPDAKGGGRTLETTLICGLQLGEWEQRLVLPAAAPWCVSADELFRSRKVGFPPGLIEQRQREHMYGLGTGLIVHFLLAALKLGVEIRTQVQTEEILREGRAVTGVRLAGGQSFQATRGVVLATGGYESNPQLVAQFEGIPGWQSYFPPSLQGDGMALGIQGGAAVGMVQHNMQLFLGFLIEPNAQSPDGGSPGRRAFQHAGIVELCSPHTLVVNGQGQRFANESVFQLLASKLREFDVHTHTLPNLPCYLVFDQNYVDSYPFGGRPVGDIPDWVVKADSIEQLARALSVPPEALASTVARFNGFASEGVDHDFGRQGDPRFPGLPTLGPLGKAPFYGVQLHPAGSSSAGLTTNAHAQACTQDGQAIPGLYVVGNAAVKREIGTGYQAGLTIASGMTFGWRAARHLCGGGRAT